MPTDGLTIIRGPEIEALLEEREHELVDLVRRAYLTHAAGNSCLPQSTFVQVPGGDRQRVIALPGYLGGDASVLGVKWIASFPGNLERGLDRASAVVVLNSVRTGRPLALLEASVVSARRTAASAALAASALARGEDACVGLVGGGPVNFEIVRFLRAVLPRIGRVTLFDTDRARADGFVERCAARLGGIDIEVAASLDAALDGATIVSLATTAVTPHMRNLDGCAPGAVVLHVSLRDLTPEVILAGDNIVDDVEHVCRAQTSVHLASMQTGNTDFIRGDLASVLARRCRSKPDADQITIFSPFGLGVLDLAVAERVYELATRARIGVTIDGFFPDAWARVPASEVAR